MLVEALPPSIGVIPVRVDDASPPKSLARWPVVDLFAENGFERLQGVLANYSNNLASLPVNVANNTMAHVIPRDPPSLDWFTILLSPQFLTIGFFGLALFCSAVSVGIITTLLPYQRVMYITPDSPQVPLGFNPQLWVILITSLIAGLFGARITRAYGLLSGIVWTVTVVCIVFLATLLLSAPPTVARGAERPRAVSSLLPSGSATVVLQPTASITAPVPLYQADITVSGPETIASGASATVVVTASINVNMLAVPRIPLTESSGYTATVSVQPGNFEIDATVAGKRDPQPLALGRSASWVWVITPKEKRLGKQSLVLDIAIYDRNHQRIGAPFSEIRIEITDPFGLSAQVVYGVGVFGALVAALGILPSVWKRYIEGRADTPSKTAKQRKSTGTAHKAPYSGGQANPTRTNSTATAVSHPRRRGKKPPGAKNDDAEV